MSKYSMHGTNRVKKAALVPAIALLAVAMAAPARSADLSVAPLYNKAPPHVALYNNWSGGYVGINGGGAWGSSSWTTTGNFKTRGGEVGGTIGYNWQVGPAVLGLEGDGDWASIKGTGTSRLCRLGCTTKEDFLATARGRAGWVVDRFMIYGTGGAAFGDIKATAPGFRGMTQTRTGWTVGGGVEWNVWNNWTAKAEYLHVDLGKMNCGLNCGTIVNNTVSEKEDIVRGGINYHLGNYGWGW
jgi:outer membrane immunogenic protein